MVVTLHRFSAADDLGPGVGVMVTLGPALARDPELEAEPTLLVMRERGSLTGCWTRPSSVAGTMTGGWKAGCWGNAAVYTRMVDC